MLSDKNITIGEYHSVDNFFKLHVALTKCINDTFILSWSGDINFRKSENTLFAGRYFNQDVGIAEVCIVLMTETENFCYNVLLQTEHQIIADSNYITIRFLYTNRTNTYNYSKTLYQIRHNNYMQDIPDVQKFIFQNLSIGHLKRFEKQLKRSIDRYIDLELAKS